MTRRLLRLSLALAILMAPLAAVAPPGGRIPRIGFLVMGFPLSEEELQRSPFLQTLRELGRVEGKHIAFEWRYAEGNLDRLAALAAELVRLKVDLIVTWGGANSVRAAQRATSTIPIVMGGTGDPVHAGFVASLARPGGNITGVSLRNPELTAKRLQLLKEAVSGVSRVAILADPANPYTPGYLGEMERAAPALGVQLHIQQVDDPNRLEPAFAMLTRERADALVVLPSARFTPHHQRIVDQVARSQLPAMYEDRRYTDAGGLMSYAVSQAEVARLTAMYVDKILKGATPADLPIEQPMKFELVINLKTAAALGLTIPPTLLFQATEVIR